jgi:adenylate kinase family enzyme
MGAGKTVLAGLLAGRLALPQVSFDALFWEPGWRPATEEVFARRVEAALSGPEWVVDSVYRGPAADALWERADTIVWLDLGPVLCLTRTLRRTVGNAARGRVLWNGNPDSWRRLCSRKSVVLAAARDYRGCQDDIRRRVEAGSARRVVRLRDRAAVATWLGGSGG